MRNLYTILFAVTIASTAIAQQNPDIVWLNDNQATFQKDVIVIPDVAGYHVYKAELHSHTTYSDAKANVPYRVREAWLDGLDFIAITDHMEYRPCERRNVKFMKGYFPEGTKAVNNSLISKSATKDGIKSDLNYIVKEAQEEAKKYDVIVVPAIEITREPVKIGHFNALFTTDNNAIYDADPLKAIRNAKSQGALIMHNHPGWRRTSVEKTSFEKKVYSENLIDGIEVVNSSEFYPKIIDRALSENLFIAATTDMHDTSKDVYRAKGYRRHMTLVLARERSLASLREALEARRTIAFAQDMFMGSEELLGGLFKASVQLKVLYTDSKGNRTIEISNMSSLPFSIRRDENIGPFYAMVIRPFSAITVKVARKDKVRFTVENMWSSSTTHPVVEFDI